MPSNYCCHQNAGTWLSIIGSTTAFFKDTCMALYQFNGVPLSVELSREERRECPANTYDKICICQLIQVDCL